MGTARTCWRELWDAFSLKRWGIAVLSVLAGMCVGSLLLAGSAALDAGPLRERLTLSAEAGILGDNSPVFLKFRHVDMGTECIGMGVALNVAPTVASLLQARHYGACPELSAAALGGFSTQPPVPGVRYLHGYVTALRPLYSFFSVSDVRLLTGLAGLSLLAVLFVVARWRLGDVYAMVLLGTFLFSGTMHVFVLVTHGVPFWVVLIGATLALASGNKPPLPLFACIGAADALVSFLNMGSLSLGFPLLCFALAVWSDGEPGERVVAWCFWACCAWTFGFLTPWLVKWAFVSYLFPDVVLFGEAIDLYPADSLRKIGEALRSLMEDSLWQPWAVLMLALGARFYYRKLSVTAGLWAVALPALIPLIWICLLPGQSGAEHSSFVSIILWPLLAAPVFLLLAKPRKARAFTSARYKLPGYLYDEL